MKVFWRNILPVCLLGAISGLLNGLLGAGGGIGIVMGLRLIFQNKVANGRRFYSTAIAVILPLSLLSVLQYHNKGLLPAFSLGTLALPAVLGGVCGALLLRRLHLRLLNRIFAAVILLSGILLVC